MLVSVNKISHDPLDQGRQTQPTTGGQTTKLSPSQGPISNNIY